MAEDGDLPFEHRIWVKEIDDEIEASIAFVHELVHASQTEGYGAKEYKRLDDHFQEEVGYDRNPFELEAESLAQFYVRIEGLRPLRRISPTRR
jgi:hypothetical protein